jgi:hypothetical protein
MVQYAPLTGITLGPREADKINRIITLTKETILLVDCLNARLALGFLEKFITLNKF